LAPRTALFQSGITCSFPKRMHFHYIETQT
jgi:hypothetical protein